MMDFICLLIRKYQCMGNTKKINVVNITFYNFLSRILFYGFVFLSSVYASRVLPTEMFGKLQYINFSIVVLWTVFNLGGAAALQRYFAHAFKSANRKDISTLSKYWIIFVIASILLSCSCWWMYGILTHRPIKFMLFIYASSQILNSYVQVMAQSTFSYKKIAIGNSLISVLGILVLYFLLPRMGIDGYIFTFTGVNLFLSIWNIYVWKSASINLSPAFEYTHFNKKEFFKTCLALAASSILAAILWQRTELFFVKKILGFEQLAIYGVALSMLALTTEIFRILPGALMPYFSAHKNQGNRNSHVYYTFMRYFTWLIVFVCLFIGVDASHIIQSIYTSKYEASGPLLSILLIGYSFGSVSFLSMQLHIGMGRNRFLMIQDFLGAVLVIGLCLYFIPVHGIVGAAWAKSISMLIIALLGIWYTTFRLQFPFPLRYITLSIMCALVVIFPLQHIFTGNILLLSIKFIVSFALYFALSIQVGVIEKKRLNVILGRILNLSKNKN